MSNRPKVRTCLWFDGTGEEAAEFYVSLLPESAIQFASRPAPGKPALVVELSLAGTPYMFLNGGPEHKLSPAASIAVRTANQAETDRLWNALVADGGEESRCGWLTDRFGVSWQIVPGALPRMLGADDGEAAGRAMQEMLQMKKIDIADTMLADEMPKIGSTSPATLDGTSVVLDLHVADSDAVFLRALNAGAEEIYPLADQFYSDRAGRVRDPFGHHWIIATRLREVPAAEMVAAFKAMFGDAWRSAVRTIDEYLASFLPEQRAALEALRGQILAAASGAEECISYSQPAFRKGRVNCGFCSTKMHCALYLFSETTLDAFTDERVELDVSKGTVLFQPGRPSPLPS